jgi:hypothetical protein
MHTDVEERSGGYIHVYSVGIRHQEGMCKGQTSGKQNITIIVPAAAIKKEIIV